jgi:hypothetical protein
VTVKMLDPLGRFARLHAAVPAAPVLHPPEIADLEGRFVTMPVTGVQFISLRWRVLSPIAADRRAEYRLGLAARRMGLPVKLPVVEADISLDQVPVAATDAEARGLLAASPASVGIVQVGDNPDPPYQFGVWLRHKPPLEITIALQDPSGQTDTAKVHIT